MVTLRFKLMDIGLREVRIAGPLSFAEILQLAQSESVGSCLTCNDIIAVRKNRIVRGDDLVEDGDEVDIFPAISGG